MATNNSSNWLNATTTTVTINEAEYWFITLVFFGIGGTALPIGNIAMAIGILRDHINLRTRFMCIVLFLVFTRAVQCTSTLFMFLYRTFFLSSHTSAVFCFSVLVPIVCSRTLEMVLLLGLVVDRTLAIVYYRYYHTLNYKQALKACAYATSLTSFAKLVLSFFGVDFNKTSSCLSSLDVLHPLYFAIWQHIDFILGVLTLMGYIALILYIRVKFLPSLKQVGREEHQAGMQALRQHKKLIPALKRMVILHCGGSLVDRALLMLSAILPDYIVTRLAPYRVVPSFVDQIGNIVVLLYYEKDLRRAAFPCYDSNQTTVISIQQPRNRR